MSTSPCGFQPTTGIGYNIAYKTSDWNPNTPHVGILEAFHMKNAMEDEGALRLMVEDDFFN